MVGAALDLLTHLALEARVAPVACGARPDRAGEAVVARTRARRSSTQGPAGAAAWNPRGGSAPLTRAAPAFALARGPHLQT